MKEIPAKIFAAIAERWDVFFTEENQFIWKGKLQKNQLIIQLQGAHEYSIIEDSQVLEIKNGPYFGPEKDRTRI